MREHNRQVAGLLNVCTANRCRSVLAERLFRHYLPYEVPVASAGLRARVGEPIWPDAERELLARNISSFGFESAPISDDLVLGADLILGATRRQRDEIAASQPSAFQRIFTWRELAWLLRGARAEEVPGATVAEKLRALPTVAAGRRSRMLAPPPLDLDVVDPVELGPGAVAEATRQIDSAIRVIVAALGVSVG